MISRTRCAVLGGLVAASAIVACARTPGRQEPDSRPAACAPPLAPYLRTSLYFDRANTRDPSRPFDEGEWGRFITEVLVQHLPNGGTIFDNTGWWRRPNGTTFRGIGRTLLILAPLADSSAHRAGALAVVDAIKSRYGHQLVIREEARVCAQF